MQLRKAIEGFITSWDFLIDTQITFTVHGPGADFPDLTAAMVYLMKYRFGQNGFATLQLAPGTFTYVSRFVTIGHPQNDRIGICGATMKAPVPINSGAYAQNGNSAPIRANDTAINLAMLRTKFATELHFTNGGAIVVDLAPLAFFDGILMTGDGTVSGASDAQMLSWTAGSAATGATYRSDFFFPPQGIANGLACVGGGYGFTVISGGATYFGTRGPLIALGNVVHGIVGNARSYCACWGPAIISLANGSDGLQADFESTFDNWFWNPNATILLNCNGGQGINASHNSNVALAAANGQGQLNNNAGSGAFANTGTIQLARFQANGNGVSPFYATNRAIINIGTSTYSGSNSPGININGNNNSLITT